MMRYVMGILWLMLSVAPALAASWPLGDVSFNGLGDEASRFVYVPPGQRFEQVQLHVELPPGEGQQRLVVHLDDRPQHHLRWQEREQRVLTLPDLSSGFHRLDLVGWPSPLGLEAADTRCPVLQVSPLALRDPVLRYRPVTTGDARLSDLPAGLFNPSHPKEPTGWLQVDQPGAYTAAARLISGWSDSRRVHWLTGSAAAGKADFRVRLREDRTLDSEALLLLQTPDDALDPLPTLPLRHLPTLEIRYRTLEGLTAAVHRLLDDDQRVQLTARHAEVSRPVREPDWARLETPQTLADLGFEDLRLDGSQQRSLALPFPPHWQPTGVLSGTLRLRGQAGLPAGSRLDVWVNEALSGSQPVNELTSHDIQRSVPLDGSRVAQTAALGMRLDAQLEMPRDCTWPLWGSLWLDAEQSRLELPHLQKSGVMAVVPRLLADPGVTLDARHPDAAMQLLSGLMELTRLASTPHPLPYRIGLGKRAEHYPEEASTLSLLVDTELQERLMARYPSRVTPGFVAGALRWQADQEGRSLLTAASPEVLRQAATVIGEMGYRLPDGARDVLIHAREGTLVVLDEQPRVTTAPARPISREQLEWGLLAVGGLVLLLLIGLLWRGWRKRRRAAA